MKSTVQLISTAFAAIALLAGKTARGDTASATTTLNLSTPVSAISGGFGVYTVSLKQLLALSPDARKNLLANQTIASPEDLNTLLANIVDPSIRSQATAYIVNIVRWKDVAHTGQPTSNWYVFESEMVDSTGTKTAQHFYLESDQDVVKRTTLQGQKNILLVYLYLRADDSAPIDPGTSEDHLMQRHANAYKAVLTEEPSAFKSDLKTLLGILNIPALNAASNLIPTAADTVEGFTAAYLMTDSYDTSTIQLSTAYDFTGAAFPLVTLTATSQTAAIDGSAKGLLTFTSSDTLKSDLIVNFTLGGTAVAGTDYGWPNNGAVPFSVTIPAGATSATLPITATGNSTGANPETAKFTLSPGLAYGITSAKPVEIDIVATAPAPAPVALVPAAPTPPTQPAPAAGDSKTAAATISSPSFTDQPLTFVGLSIAFPVTSYKQVTYTSSSGTLLPQSATEQSLYANLDFYIPAVDPDLIALRWLPHPFIGLPLSGKVLDHPMAGIAVSLKYGEIFWGAIDDLQNENANGSSHHTIKGVFGIKFSVSAAKTLLGSK
jgi:hypothetical protein